MAASRVVGSTVWTALTIALGLCVPPAAHAALSASSSTCLLTTSYGNLVGQNCVTGGNGDQGSTVALGGNTAAAFQEYGIFHGSAFSSNLGFAGVGEGGGSRSAANGFMSDLLTITGGTGSGLLTFAWTITGSTILGAGATTALLDMYTSIGSTTEEFIIQQAGTYAVTRIPFTFGKPFDFLVSSTVTASSGYAEESFGHAYATSAAADFSHTSILTGIDAFDLSGAPLEGITITAASGTRYPLVAAQTPPSDPGAPTNGVPEPATWALLIDGLATFVLMRRLRRGKRTTRDYDAMTFA